MATKFNIFISLFVMLIVISSFGQGNPKELADKNLEKYIELSTFQGGFQQNSVDSFLDLFHDSASIIFDIPFKNVSAKLDDIKKISKDDREQPIIYVYGKCVSPGMYMEILQREATKFDSLKKLDYKPSLTGKTATSQNDSNIFIYEVGKVFSATDWSVSSNEKYLVFIQVLNEEAKIKSISESNLQTDVLIKFVSASPRRVQNEDVWSNVESTTLRVAFEEPINDMTFHDTTNTMGQFRFDNVANYNSVIYLDTVISKNDIRYEIPWEWKKGGKPVSDQPAGGFTIGLYPYEWNGFAFSLFLEGGRIAPERMMTNNFQPGSNFENTKSYKVGLGVNTTYFINHTQWKSNTKNWLIGVGAGLSFNYHKSNVISSEFTQKRYKYIDIIFDTCHVEFSGKDFSEKNTMVFITVPVFGEFIIQASKKLAFSCMLGVNLSRSITRDYRAKGEFSRHGYYDELGDMPIDDDDWYNYFSNSIKSYEGINTNTFWAEGFIKLNVFFNVFKKSSDNSLQLGMIFAVPFTKNKAITYPNSQLEDYQGYWINTENEEYHSVVYSTKKIYNYYFGLSVGINFIRYKPR